jgi:RNA polymerase sigma-70 factor (ECF subfamily)
LQLGDPQAFNKLYYEYYKIVFSNIFKLVKNQAEAEDILQDVFVALWQNRHRIDASQPLLNWLIVVSYNKSMNFLEKSIQIELTNTTNNLPINQSEVISIDHEIVEQQLVIFNEAVENLPTRKREAFILCKLEGKTYDEAAKILGISSNTVREHVHFALKLIKDYSQKASLNSACSAFLLYTLYK